MGLLTRRSIVFSALSSTLSGDAAYFPPPDAQGGWRRLQAPSEVRKIAGIDVTGLDKAFEYAKTTTKHGGLLVVRRGSLVYEKYFGKGHREATPALASCGKSFTSISVGILLREQHGRFAQGLDQRVFTREYLPEEAFPLSDPRKSQIRLGHLLAMTAGIRGNNPAYVDGKEVTLDPAGPDGWIACLDAMAFGKQNGPLNAISLWCDPGGGYSYATSSIHVASVVLRKAAKMELQEYVASRLADPLGWGRWGWGYRKQLVDHTPGGGGIALRPPDMLRFAYLLLRRGKWAERQVVPANYVAHCAAESPYNRHYPYSLQFNVNTNGQVAGVPKDAFWKTGSGGHAFFVIPSLDVAAFKLGGRDDQYDPAQTNVPPPEVRIEYDGTRDDWKPSSNLGNYAERTLQMIAASIV
jgi:CubicO group peptidase (beta-lactamase class C family)